MSLNDKEHLAHSGGVAAMGSPTTIPTSNVEPIASNFVSSPPSHAQHAGHHRHHHPDIDRETKRMQKRTAGVIEARPGIIESTNIDPLNENSNKGQEKPQTSVCRSSS
ncbi:hypothetical protein AX17_003279 [Amanita inopinata Kibby_2008]|nr:hypothetical protein AX17_003279 [Amanita inopinata Kibby_2008]